MRSQFLLLTLLFLTPFFGCCTNQTDGPKPVDNFDRLVEMRVEQWLDPRMDIDSWQIFHGQQQIWEASGSLDALANWFKITLGEPSGVPVLWDFAAFISELKGSELFSRGPPTDAELLRLLIQALKKYQYEDQ